MTTTIKSLIALVLAIVIAGTIYGAYFYPKVAYGAAPGTTNTTSKSLSEDLVVATDTVYAMQNTSQNAYVINSVDFYAASSTATTTTYGINCATSTNGTGYGSNTNYILSELLNTIGTTTGNGMYFSSSTPGLSGQTGSAASTTVRVLLPGTWLVCKAIETGSTNALNTLDANTVGFLRFSIGIY